MSGFVNQPKDGFGNRIATSQARGSNLSGRETQNLEQRIVGLFSSPADISAHDLVAKFLNARRPCQLGKHIVKLWNVVRAGRSIVLPTMHINHQKWLSGTMDDFNCAPKLISIPKVALFVKFH